MNEANPYRSPAYSGAPRSPNVSDAFFLRLGAVIVVLVSGICSAVGAWLGQEIARSVPLPSGVYEYDDTKHVVDGAISGLLTGIVVGLVLLGLAYWIRTRRRR